MTLIATYTGTGLVPSRDPEDARTDSVKLAPGYYAQGTVIGEYTLGAAANEVQTATVTGTPTGGTFRLAFNGLPTAALAHNASAAVVQAALEALTNIGTGNVTVGLSGAVYTITFVNALGNQDQALLTLFSNNLTGGTTPSVTLAVGTAGRAAGIYYGAYDNGLSDGREVAKAIVKYNTTVGTDGRHQYGNVFFGLQNDDYTAVAYLAGTFYTGDGTTLLLPGLDSNAVADLGKLITGGTLTSAATELKIGV